MDDVSREVIIDAGFGDAILHRTGHSLGTSVHFNGVNIDNLESQDRRQLIPGVMFTLEPGIYLPGKTGIRIEDVVLITRSGCEVLSQTPRWLTR